MKKLALRPEIFFRFNSFGRHRLWKSTISVQRNFQNKISCRFLVLSVPSSWEDRLQSIVCSGSLRA
jgi:hypothetical protein